MNIFGIGLPEMALIFIVALLIFGPKKLPEIGRSLGKALKGFQDASREFQEEFKKEAEQIEKVITAPMEAKIEPPSQKALTATPTEEVVTGADIEASEPEVITPTPVQEDEPAPSQAS